MKIDLSLIKQLRELTNAGISDCKDALEESNGNIDEAVKILRKKGVLKSLSRSSREVSEGWIGSYIHHNGRLGSLLMLKCETDFVARTDLFKDLAHSLAIQVVTSSPEYISKEDVPIDIINKEKELISLEKDFKSKEKSVQEKIIEGRLSKFFEEICLLEQKFYKDEKLKVKDLIDDMSSKTGENIKIEKFSRFEIGI
jgi:elongation factor Ts